MMRSDNSDDATHAFAQLSGRKGVTMTFRSSKGNRSYQPKTWYRTSPVQTSAWLRLVKKMDKVEMYRSENGSDWTLHASVTVLFPDDTFRVGLAVTSHDNSHVSEATFEDYQVQEYNFPTSSPSLSAAPTNWDSDVEIGGARAGSHSIKTLTLTLTMASLTPEVMEVNSGVTVTHSSSIMSRRMVSMEALMSLCIPTSSTLATWKQWEVL